MTKEINYQITLNHNDFVMLLHILRTSRENGVINWDANSLICENTKIIER